MKFDHPHTIDNGSGETITFLRYVSDEEGDYLEVENEVRPGAGPPMHVHYLQEECMTVVSGRIAAQIEGEAPRYYGPGETVLFNRGVSHRFWNAGDKNLICKGWIRPAHNIEYFLTEVFKSVKANGGSTPGAFDGAYLLSKYRTEFDLRDIPAFVKRFIFPVTLLIGRIIGKFRKFADGPEAIMK